MRLTPDLRSILMSRMGLFCLLLGLSTVVYSQVTSSIQGQIVDSSGAVLPGAEVSATNDATGVTRKVISADDGFYRLRDLLPGNYTVRVSLTGFKTAVKSDVTVTSAAVVGLNLKLEVGQITDTVTVTGGTTQVETQVTRISEVLEDKEIRNLPTFGRGIYNLSLITPGIVGKQEQGGEYCCDVFSNFGAPRINSGADEQKAAFSLDGVDLRYSEGSGWGASFSPNPDAVDEIRVTVNPHSAEYGRTSGPQVQVVTKGGTNSFHGTGHYTYNGTSLNARPFFSGTNPDITYQLYGGTFGGPIKKDRLFFFGSYEGLRSESFLTSRSVVETKEFRDLVVNTRPNSIAAKLFQLFPPVGYANENVQDVGSPAVGPFAVGPKDGIPDLGVYSFASPYQRDGNQFNARMDYNIPNNKDRLFFTYWFSHPKWGEKSARPAFDGVTDTAVASYHVSESHAFSPTILNEARFGVDIINFDSGAPFKRFPHIPDTFADDGFGISTHYWSSYDSNVKSFSDVFSINKGKHGFKFGFEYRNVVLLPNWNNQPSFEFASILNFANDEPYFSVTPFDLSGTRPGGIETDVHSRTGDTSLFIQNTWQIRSNLTLNYGLRWEYFWPVWLEDQQNWQAVINSSQLNPAGVGQIVNKQAQDRFWDRRWSNFGPRFGISWDPTKTGRMSVRGGFGLLYDEINTYIATNGIDQNPPALAFLDAGVQLGIPIVYGLAPEGTYNFPKNPNLLIPKLTPAGGIEGERPRLVGAEQDLKYPRVFDSMMGVQYQLFPSVVAAIDYKYRRGMSELYRTDVNRFQGDLLDGKLDRLNPNFSQIEILTNRGFRKTHNIVASVSKRFSQGWSLTAAYNYANSKNNFGSVMQGKSDHLDSAATDPFNPKLDIARDDIPHTLTAHSLWELPIWRTRSDWVGKILGGWNVNTIWNFQAGQIFTPRSTAAYGSGGDFNADGLRLGYSGNGGDRPDAPSQSLPSSFSKSEWLKGPLSASMFPIPDPSNPRPGTMARDYFRGPGYANVDVSFLKEFVLPLWGKEPGRLQIRGEFFNVANHLNISSVQQRINAANFATATGAFPNRKIEIGVKYVF